MTEGIDAVRVFLALAGLSAAALTDLKSREVPDRLWYAMAAAALVLFALDFDARFGGTAWVLAIPVGLIFIVAVTGGELISVFPGETLPEGELQLSPGQQRIWRTDKILSLGCVAAAALVFAMAPRLDLGAPTGVLTGPEAVAYSTCVMVVAGFGFYIMGALHGGADAKGFMVLALLFPVFPVLPFAPLSPPSEIARAIVPFALAVLFNGALTLVLAGPVAFLLIGVLRKRLKVPESLFGYEKPVAAFNIDREFLLGTVAAGAWRRKLFVTRGSHSDEAQKAALDFLKSRGIERVFVSPKLPFMVNLLAGLLIAISLGSPLYWV